MNLQEMIAKIVNLDPKKDYTISESSPVEQVIVPTANIYQQDTQPNNTIPQSEQNISVPNNLPPINQPSNIQPIPAPSPAPIQNEDYKQLYEDMLNRNRLLEQANLNLLNNMPAQQKERSTEELILEVVGRGDLLNANN